MSLDEPSVDFHLRTQQANFRVPYELLRKNIKDIQKLDEKQFRKIAELTSDLSKNDVDKKAKLRQIIASMKHYEKKMRARYDAEQELISRIKTRIAKLTELKTLKEAISADKDHKDADVNRERLLSWYRDQTNLLIVEYLLRNNVTKGDNPGLALLKDLKFDELVDSDIILKSNQISNSILLNHDLIPLIGWIQENKSYLKKTKSSLEFQSRFQEYIEFIKKGEISSALSIFNSHLAGFTRTNFEEIRLASGLLIFLHDDCLTEEPKLKKYVDLFSEERYKYLSDLFLEIYYKMYGIPQDDPLLVYLSVGISTLKTKSCKCASTDKEDLNFETLLKKKMNQREDPSNPNNHNCPVCSLEMNQLSEQLPYSHNVESFLFDNPVMLPNGNIFDKTKLISYTKGLKTLAEDELMDPITSTTFKIDDLVTMYPT
jgi:macrophage erythroblast attacher